MLRYGALLSLCPLLLLASPASALTKEQKFETCKFGADNDKLAGAKRNAFIKRCMAKGNYEPAARKDAMKKTGTKTPTPKMAPASAPKPQ